MELTPMMKQYMQIKEKYKDCILFYRLGDFYEMFFEDAKIASKELELVLTGKNCGLEERAPMCGVPFHAASSYISKLINKGYKVAIGEQIEDPATAKGIVKRDVIKVITPGTYVESNGDEEYKNTYLMTIYEADGVYGVASSDISTGEFKTTFFKNSKIALLDEISKIAPKEILIHFTFNEELIKEIKNISTALVSVKNFDEFYCTDEEMLEQFASLDLANLDARAKMASATLLKYILDTQKISLSNINLLETYDIVNYMSIDSSSRRNLELTENLRDKTKRGSLIWVLDKTATSMGGRCLRKWIEEPLIKKAEIEERLSAVEELYDNVYVNEDIREALKHIYDIERIVGKISNNNVNARDLVSLNSSLKRLPEIKTILKDVNSPLLKHWYNDLDVLEDIRELLTDSILEDPAITLKEGNVIKDGYSAEIDELRNAKLNGKQWIASLENQEREFTGIKSLKVGYNKVFGYYIEISKANYDMIPEGRYIRKQTLANAERYITQELKEMEEKILGAEEKLVSLEYKIFTEIRERVEKEIPRLKKTANIIASLDVISTLAIIAVENNYVKPSINEEGVIEILEGRHPVVEKVIGNGEFICNDTHLNKNGDRFLLITGPNMAGKSTYMRQVALINLMAQIGSFVPAKSANISVSDKIFTRIGASDDLAGGKSTFMVEMWEVSNILKNATSKSLVLLDEVGRGTSTYDGLSIAWAVIEYICNESKLKCNTLFATHYHELTKLEGVIEGVKNYSVAVTEKLGQVIFLRKIVEGGADQSYGIEVAKLAGLPEAVINRAKDILSSLEGEKAFEIDNMFSADRAKEETIEDTKQELIKEAAVTEEIKEEVIEEITEVKHKAKHIKEEIAAPMQMDFTMMEKDDLLNEIASIDVMMMTPLDAMNKLFEVIQRAKKL